MGDGFKGVLCEMIYDDVTQAAIDNKILPQFGEHMFNQYGSDVRNHDYVRQQLCQLARLVLEAKKDKPADEPGELLLPLELPTWCPR